MASATFDLIPGRVSAHVFTHEMRPRTGAVPCLTYVTEGLEAFDQRELAFTLVHAGGEVPQAPLGLLAQIGQLAAQGRLVEAGGLTELGPTGAFGQPNLRGFAYQTAWPMEGVTLPPRALSMIALFGDEIETAKRFGTLRVLARLGRAHNFWPTAPWCSLDRTSIAPPTPTILENVATAHVAGTSAVLDGEHVILRVDRRVCARLQAGLPPPDIALALLLVLDPRADACLVWSPGQTSAEAISVPNGTGTRISGCFIAFVPQQERDVANPFEDGFAAMLTDASWTRVREALFAGTPLAFANLAIEWY